MSSNNKLVLNCRSRITYALIHHLPCIILSVISACAGLFAGAAISEAFKLPAGIAALFAIVTAAAFGGMFYYKMNYDSYEYPVKITCQPCELKIEYTAHDYIPIVLNPEHTKFDYNQSTGKLMMCSNYENHRSSTVYITVRCSPDDIKIMVRLGYKIYVSAGRFVHKL